MAFIPSPPVNGIHVGPAIIHFHALMYLVSNMTAIMITRRRWRAAGGDPSLVGDVALRAVPAGIIGGRICFDLTTPADIPHHWWGMFAVWSGGRLGGESLLSMFLKKEHITAVLNTGMDRIEEDRLVLADGRSIGFSYAMIVPPFIGQEVIRSAGPIADEKGYVKVRDTYQADGYDDVYAVGIAAVHVPGRPPPGRRPQDRLPDRTDGACRGTEHRGADPRRGGSARTRRPATWPRCVMDAGNNGVIILADKMLPPRKHGVLIPGPQAHAMKLGFEKYFLWKGPPRLRQLP